VWAGLIAVILGAMALGYHFGGRIADKNATTERIGLLLLAASAASLISWGMRDLAPTWFINPENSVTTEAVVVGAILFMPTVVLLAMISPMLAKNLIKKMDATAKVVGELNAVGTAGSIVGAVGTGLFLIPNFGVSEIMLSIPLTLFLVSVPLVADKLKKYLPFVALCVVLALSVNAVPTRADEVIADISTAYSRIFVYRPGGGDVLGMADSPWGVQCAMRVDENNIADETDVSFSYLFAYDLVVRKFFSEHIGRALFLGGCVEVFPRFILKHYPDTTADSVEIDPGVTEIARKYFGFRDENFPSLTIHHEDARTFINETHEPYNLIMLDVWDPSGRPVFYMASREAFGRVADALAPNGIVIMHINGIPSNKKSYMTASTLKTARSVFKHARLYQFKNDPDSLQNLIIVLSNDQELPDTFTDPAYPGKALSLIESAAPGIIFTDNYAPVDGFTDWNNLVK
jgi:predicted membrane-bound spermidine synthase